MQIQILRRSCDNPKCDVSVDLKPGHLTPMQEAEMSNWIVLTKEHVLNSGENPTPLGKIACCATCAVEIIRNGLLDLPKRPIN